MTWKWNGSFFVPEPEGMGGHDDGSTFYDINSHPSIFNQICARCGERIGAEQWMSVIGSYDPYNGISIKYEHAKCPIFDVKNCPKGPIRSHH